jgi:hypothetical protein
MPTHCLTAAGRLRRLPASLGTLALLLALPGAAALAEEIDEDQLGGWYMYFFSHQQANSPWGFQGDVQYRNWDLAGDLEQLLLRGGVTWQPASADVKLTLGYANITSGEFGSSDDTDTEHRAYQEALLPQRVGKRLLLTHRFRYEQRWVDGQDFRTRFRYALFANVPLNGTDLGAGTWYLALYNELFVNGERDIGDDRRVEHFDRNRLYGALGRSLKDNVRVQLGYMYQTTEAGADKGQLQLSLHHSF